jgi:predicted TIM-barrel fold metal-dependent hydrolase
MKHLLLVVSLFVVAAFAQDLNPQSGDPQLSAYIDSIPAIDNHAHVFALDVPDDKGYDALRCEELPPWQGPDPANFRFSDRTRLAWKALYGVEPAGADDAEKRRDALLAKLRQEHGDELYAWLLEQAKVSTVLANRVIMTPALKPPHFLWVPYDDALLFPLNNAGLKEANPDRRALFTMEDQVRQRYLQESGVNALPTTLDGYLEKVLRATLSRQKEAGAVAIKFEAAYLRSLDFESAAHDAAAAIYARSVAGAIPPAADYKLLQDFLFHEVAAEAGKLGMAVHIHTGAGCGQFFSDPGSDPMLLTATFNDASLRGTNFVMLHGGTPFNRHPTSLIVKPNVYVDTSVLEFWFSPAELARIMRPWLETMPERVIYGSDADFLGPGIGWPEANWLGAHNFRSALSIVLSDMVHDGAVTTPRAKEIAEDVLRGNAAKLYHLSPHP